MNRRKFLQNSLLTVVLVPVTKYFIPKSLRNSINDINGYWNIMPFDRIFRGIKAGSFYKIYPDFRCDKGNSYSQEKIIINAFCDSLFDKLINGNRSKRILIRKYSEDFQLIMKYLFARGFTNDSLHNLQYENILELENDYERSYIFKNQNDYYDKILKNGFSIIYIFDHKTNNDLCIMPAYPRRCNELNNTIEVEFSYPIVKGERNNNDNAFDKKIINVCLVSDDSIYSFHLLFDITNREIKEKIMN